MNNKKQTAVEWLVDQILNNKCARVISTSTFYLKDEIIEQAKDLEKQQIINAAYFGHLKGFVDNGVENSYAEQYYTETYEEQRNK